MANFFDFNNMGFVSLLVVWSLPWKGVALWKAAWLGQKKWFVALLIVNTLGILEALYIFRVASKYEVVEMNSHESVG